MSYKNPFDSVIPECRAEWVAASKSQGGGDIEAHLAALLHDATTFKQFNRELERLTQSNTFDRLPRFRLGNERFDHVHCLTVGPWRGVYLVSTSTSQVYGMLFTKFPHNLQKKDFDEILARYRESAKGTDSRNR